VNPGVDEIESRLGFIRSGKSGGGRREYHERRERTPRNKRAELRQAAAREVEHENAAMVVTRRPENARGQCAREPSGWTDRERQRFWYARRP